jgi:hypothetical protein
MSQVNEFALNLPMTSPSAVGDTVAGAMPAAPPMMSYVDCTASTQLPPDVDPQQCDHINVYVDSAQVTGYDQANPMVSVDLVMNVSITEPVSGRTSTYKIVKRLSLDKCKLACDAEHMTPVQVVEAEDDPLEVAQIMEQFYAAKRAREMAGLTESAGTKKFKVLFRFDDVDANKKWDESHPESAGAKHSASAEVVIDHVKDKAHARHVWTLKHGKHAKYPNAKITRVTEVV